MIHKHKEGPSIKSKSSHARAEGESEPHTTINLRTVLYSLILSLACASRLLSLQIEFFKKKGTIMYARETVDYDVSQFPL